MERKSRAKILQKNIRYQTYQLSAVADSKRETPEKQLIICALHVLEWLRTKLQKFDIPDGLNAPSPEECSGVQLSDLKNVRIDMGYIVEIVSILEEKTWAFRLTEPDLSTRFENGEEVSTAVPGRIFETNIAFRVKREKLHCGISVVISEPENTKDRCPVYRPAVVQRLIMDPRIQLSSGYPLQETLWQLDSKAKLKRLQEYRRTGMLPIVIFCDFVKRSKKPILLQTPGQPKLPDFDVTAFGSHYVDSLRRDTLLSPEPVQKENEFVPYDTDQFSKARMAYVQSFCLPANQFETFFDLFQIQPESGAILFLEPTEVGDGCVTYRYSGEKREENYGRLMELSRDYLRGKAVRFDQIFFLTQARLLQIERFQRTNASKEDTVKMYEDKIILLQREHKDELLQKDEQIGQQADKITRLKSQLDEEEKKTRKLWEAVREREQKADARIQAVQEQLAYFKSLPRRPRTPKDIPQWVEENFKGRLKLHERAIKMLQDVPPGKVDQQLLCDAIEYLAREYRDQKANLISQEEANRRSSEKYGRPFEVTPCGSTTIEAYPVQYKIKYKIGYDGKPIDTPLSEHLKVGIRADNLIRIYFLYDEEEKMIVVGALPDHLKVIGINA